jgi:hypothetical protein
MTEPKKLSDVEAMSKIKKIMEQVCDGDREYVARWLCDKYGPGKAADAAAAHG